MRIDHDIIKRSYEAAIMATLLSDEESTQIATPSRFAFQQKNQLRKAHVGSQSMAIRQGELIEPPGHGIEWRRLCSLVC